jgi:hypothetical protein
MVLPAVAALSLTACTGDLFGTSSCESTPVGRYYLVLVNNSSLPYALTGVGAEEFEIVSDVISVNAEGVTGRLYSEAGSFRITENGNVTTAPSVSDDGTYDVANGVISFTSRVKATTFSGSLSNGTLKIIFRSAGPLLPLPRFDVGGATITLDYSKGCNSIGFGF